MGLETVMFGQNQRIPEYVYIMGPKLYHRSQPFCVFENLDQNIVRPLKTVSINSLTVFNYTSLQI